MTIVLGGGLSAAEAAAALQEAGETRAVVVGELSDELAAALRRAGAEPFGVIAVPPGDSRLVAAAQARLDALPRGERGRPSFNGGAISRRSLFSRAAVTQLPVAALDERACIGTARCGLCVAGCPVAAIASTSPVPTIDPGACTACGRCVPGCPQGALRLTGASAAQVEAQLGELEELGIVFACANADVEAEPGWAVVELPTLALVSVGWVLQLRARGIGVRLAPCDGSCCAGVVGVSALAQRLPVRLTSRLTLVEPRATAEALGFHGDAVEDAASPLGLLSVDAGRCTLCGACSAACPTEALWLDEDADAAVLRHRPAACVGCGRCVTACPEHAVAVRPGVDPARLAAIEDVAAAPRERCTRCGADLPPEPMRRRVRELLPELADAPLDLCASCARLARSSS